jgi:glycosyltransferase involved in cell wall biosynthesis
MRIVMACTDMEWIDRRIFHEAKSLREAGHEVILFTVPDMKETESLTIDGVLVIRRHSFVHHLGEPGETTSQRIGNRLRNATWLPGNVSFYRFLKNLKYAARRIKGLLTAKQAAPELPIYVKTMSDVETLSEFEASLVTAIVMLKPDCVVAHDLPMLRAAVHAGRTCGAKIAYDAHECYPDQLVFPPEHRDYYRRLETRWIGEADLAYTVNPILADYMSRVYQRQVEFITNAIEPPADLCLDRKYDYFRESLQLPSNVNVLLYQGGLFFNRGLENLVESMRYVQPHVHLCFLGYGDSACTKALVDLATEYGIQSSVHIVPPRQQADLLQWTASADVGIIPYHAVDKNAWYVSPNKMFEYIAAELPFLANELPFVRTIVEDLECGRIADLTTPSLCAEAINRMFSDANQLARMRANLRARREEYLWKEQGKRLIGMYEAIGIASEVKRAA